MNDTALPHTTDPQALQARFGARVASLLNEQVRRTPPDIGERLRVGREQAVARARLARARSRQAVVAGGLLATGGRSGQAALLGGPSDPPGWWLKLASILPLAMLVCGLLAIDQLHEQAQISAAAEVDAALLADDLPPAAYSDPGFVEYLKTGRD